MTEQPKTCATCFFKARRGYATCYKHYKQVDDNETCEFWKRDESANGKNGDA